MSEAYTMPVATSNGDDRLIELATQLEFISHWLALAAQGHPAAMEAATHIPPEVLKDKFLRESYDLLAPKVAKGEGISDMVTDRQWVNVAKANNRLDQHARLVSLRDGKEGSPDELKRHGRMLLVRRRTEVQYELCMGAALLTKQVLEGAEPRSAKQIADGLFDGLVRLHSRMSEEGGPVTQLEIALHLLEKVDAERTPGVDWPWPSFQREMGTIVPGDVIGLSAYSGSGKTMFIANLFLALVVLKQVPVIVYPTEMGLRFMERVGAILARVPKRYAEKGDWRESTPEQRERYRKAMMSLVGGDWDIVKDGDLSPGDIISRTKVLRRKYRGRHVIVIVDHAHRLRYAGGTKSDDAGGAADATRQFKNHATSDTEGGLSYIVLYQPRQPENPAAKYRPVSMYGIRGHSGSTTELDVHMSCFLRLVKCDDTGVQKTPWGTPSALWENPTDPLPAPGVWEERGQGTKVDDEHFYLNTDKDRVNGETSYTIMMHVHAPSGFIYEDDWLAGVDNPSYDEEAS